MLDADTFFSLKLKRTGDTVVLTITMNEAWKKVLEKNIRSGIEPTKLLSTKPGKQILYYNTTTEFINKIFSGAEGYCVPIFSVESTTLLGKKGQVNLLPFFLHDIENGVEIQFNNTIIANVQLQFLAEKYYQVAGYLFDNFLRDCEVETSRKRKIENALEWTGEFEEYARMQGKILARRSMGIDAAQQLTTNL